MPALGTTVPYKRTSMTATLTTIYRYYISYSPWLISDLKSASDNLLQVGL